MADERVLTDEEVNKVITIAEEKKRVFVINRNDDISECVRIAIRIVRTRPGATVYVYGAPDGPNLIQRISDSGVNDIKQISARDIAFEGGVVTVRPRSAGACRGDSPTHVMCVRMDSMENEFYQQIVLALAFMRPTVFIGERCQRMESLIQKDFVVVHPPLEVEKEDGGD